MTQHQIINRSTGLQRLSLAKFFLIELKTQLAVTFIHNLLKRSLTSYTEFPVANRLMS